MNKVIKGRRYNTDTAKELGGTWYGNYGDLDYVAESLYKTKSGCYFIYGRGGANSSYAEQVAYNSWAGGEKIMPVSYDEAREWAEENLTGEEYEAAFGYVVENWVQINATIPEDLKNKLDETKKETGETTAEIIMRLIKEM